MSGKTKKTSSSSKCRKIILDAGSDIIHETVSLIIGEMTTCPDGETYRCADFSSRAVVFPNRRPLYYILNVLARRIKGPFFPPLLFSIGELATYISREIKPGLSEASRLDKIFLLYKSAVSVGISDGIKLPSDFAGFAPWAPRIIEILEEMEMSLTDYSALKSISLTSEVPSKIRDVVTLLPAIKSKYYELLQKHNRTSYAARLKAAVSPEVDIGEIFPSVKKFYLCGFAELTNLENRFLDKLSEGKAEIVKVALAEPDSWLGNDDSGKKLRIYSAYDTHSQVKKVREILLDGHSDERISDGNVAHSASADTAIILPRPESLIPLLSEGIKGWDGKYNVSLGYPLARTPLHGFFTLLMKIEETRSASPLREMRLSDYLNLLGHPYVRSVFFKTTCARGASPEDFISGGVFKGRRSASMEEIVNSIVSSPVRDDIIRMNKTLIEPFEKVASLKELSAVLRDICSIIVKESAMREHPFAEEFLSRYMAILREELPRSLIADEIFEKKEVLFDLFNTTIESENLPFPGIPLEGLQILGLLEARNLSFKRLIVMDVNEGIVPGIEPYDPLMPPALRRILGLPTYRDREKLFRRNFIAMIASASREVHLIYRASPRDERSRYIEEIIWEKEKKTRLLIDEKSAFVESVFVRATAPLLKRRSIPKEETKYPAIIAKEISLSPSSIDRYLHCPASFYYHSILGLREEEKDILYGPGAENIGECVHAILRDFFKKYRRKSDLLTEKAAEDLAILVRRYVDIHFGSLRGEIYLLSEVIKSRLTGQFLDYERSRKADFIVQGVEEKFSSEFKFGGKNSICIEGRIDRIDKRDGVIWLIDYKTGGFETPARDLSKIDPTDLNDRKMIKKRIKSFQLPIYIWLYRQTQPTTEPYPQAAYYSLKDMKEEDLFKSGGSIAADMMEKIYLPSLEFIVKEISDVSKPFEPDDEDERRCQKCPYQGLCAC